MKTLQILLTTLVVTFLTACGGGGGGGGGTSGGAGTISGTAVKGPVGGATVTAYAITNGAKGAQIASGTTATNGNFSLSMGSYSGPVMLQVSGGSYTDEATSATMMMGSNVMTAVLQNVTAGQTLSGIQITPLTAMAQVWAQNMTGGMTAANISTANTGVGNYCNVSNILSVQPMDPTALNSGGTATQDMKDYGMCLAAMSKYASSQGVNPSSGIVTAMMNDASDGMMDGKMMGGGSVMMGGMGNMPSSAGTSGLASAMTNFINSSANQSGVTTTMMNTLIQKLNTFNGALAGGGTSGGAGMISGTAVKGPVGGATVTAYAITNGAKGAQIATGTTATNGNFNLSMGSYSGPVMLQMSGGSYTDEATSTTMMMGTNVMTAVLTSMSAGSTISGIQITPLTSMAQVMAQNMANGMTDTNISTANTGVGSYCNVSNILTVQPMNPTVLNSGGTATQDMKDYGMCLAAMSQYAKTLNMPASSGLVTMMMNDASDGIMDGKMGNTAIPMSMGGMMGGGTMSPTAGTSGLATAMTNFINSSANQSGVTTTMMNTLIQKLNTSGAL
jgi:hypothetical protein